eukprot:1160217-Pelagomonas_calceolata.AAC.23
METYWRKRAVSPLHHHAGTERDLGIWRVAGSIRLQNLAVWSQPVPSKSCKGLHATAAPLPTDAKALCVHLLQCNEVHGQLICTWLMGLSNAGSASRLRGIKCSAPI